MTSISVGAAYVQSAGGKIFLLWRRPATQPRSCVLIVPAFAEEMNKSRRMLADVAIGLARRGVATVAPDLHGTGDSAGDFGDARWQTWLADIQHAARWAEKTLLPVSGLLAVRLGAELAAEAAASAMLPSLKRSVLWQPVFDRARYLNQFLRLRAAAQMANRGARETVEGLRGLLLSGQTLEVAGYSLNPDMANAMAQGTRRSSIPLELGNVTWIEMQREANAPQNPTTKALIDASLHAGSRIEFAALAGEPFWSATETARNGAWVGATVAALG